MKEKTSLVIKTKIWGVFAEPSRFFAVMLKVLPFVLVIIAYGTFSNNETQNDPRQKVYPVYSKMATKTYKNLLTPNKRIAASKTITANEKIELKNKKIEEKNIERRASGLEETPLISLIDKNDYQIWKELQKELKEVNLQLKDTSSMSLFVKKIKLTTKSYKLGLTNSIMIQDTLSSLYRLSYSMVVASGIALLLALYMGLYKTFEYTTHNFVTVYSLIQPVAILPIIMLIFGVEDYGKIIFIILGVFPPMLLGTFLNVKAIPKQTIVKAKTLSASDTQIVFKVVLPQILPHFINTVRLTLFLGWMLLLTSEMISAETGLGYRIMLEKRFTNMDVIIPYVMWIMLISFSLDYLLARIRDKVSPWYHTR